MRKISITEAKEKQNKWDLTPAFIYNMEQGRLELYEYENDQEKEELLEKDWSQHSELDKYVALRINGAIFTDESTDLRKKELEELKHGTHMKLYKKTEHFLPHDAIKCGENYEKETGKRVRYIGVHSLLGDYLRVKIDGSFYRFNEKDDTLVGRWA